MHALNAKLKITTRWKVVTDSIPLYEWDPSDTVDSYGDGTYGPKLNFNWKSKP